MKRKLHFVCFVIAFFYFGLEIKSQVRVDVRVNSGSSTTTCTDGFLGGAPEPHWRVNVAGQGWVTYPSAGICYTNPPFMQYQQVYACTAPSTIQICLRALEDDGSACVISESCLTEICQNYPVPAVGASTTYTINVGGASTASANFTITTVDMAPEINVQGNALTILTGDSTPSTTDNTDFGSQSVCAGQITHTYRIQNTGVADLNLSSMNIGGLNASDFTVSPFSPYTVVAGSFVDFNVVFDPSALGVRSANISINSNDCDEPIYTFVIQGDGVDSEINLKGNSTSIAAGDLIPALADHSDFGTTSVCSGIITRTFTIENTGSANLNISGVTISGLNASDFAVALNPASTLLSSATTTFQIAFNPSASGLRVANVSIANDDCDESIYDFTVQGLASDPALSLLSQSDVSCYGGSDGAISVSVSGGIAPYTYSWSPGNPLGDSTSTVTGLTAGVWTCILTDVNGCTSSLALTVMEPSAITGSQTLTVCAGGSLTVGTTTHNTTGVFTDVLTAASGCDSTVTTSLTVAPAVTSSQTLTVCAGGSVTVGTTTHNTSGVFTDVLTAANGCDSTVTTNLTVSPAITGSQTLTVCSGGSVTVGTTTHNTSGVFTDVLTAANGCDSTVTTNLTVAPVIIGSQTATVCAGGSVTVGANTYTTNGTFTDVLLAANGCDSIVTTNLTIESSIDVSTTVNGATISANAIGATYQWLDCDNGNVAIFGETNSSYTASVTGNYSVIVGVGNCLDTSACVSIMLTSVDFNDEVNSVSIFPNPSNGIFTIKLNSIEIKSFELINPLGQVVYSGVINNQKELNIAALESGIYTIRINDNKSAKYYKIIKN